MKMNKKGTEGLRLLIFSAGGLLIGILVMVFLLNIAGKLLATSNEEIIAKDLGFAIMTLSASPSDIMYRYEPNTEKFKIYIKDNTVRVVSGNGEGSYKFFPMKGVLIEPGILDGVLSIPLSFRNSKVSFDDNDSIITEYCNLIPSYFNDEIKIKIVDDGSAEIQNIKSVVQLLKNPDDKITFVDDYSADLIIKLRFSTEKTINTEYFKDTASQNQNFEKVSCYLRKELESVDYIESTEFKEISEDKTIYLYLGQKTDYVAALNQDSDFVINIATRIYTGLLKGVSG